MQFKIYIKVTLDVNTENGICVESSHTEIYVIFLNIIIKFIKKI